MTTLQKLRESALDVANDLAHIGNLEIYQRDALAASLVKFGQAIALYSRDPKGEL